VHEGSCVLYVEGVGELYGFFEYFTKLLVIVEVWDLLICVCAFPTLLSLPITMKVA
jgi:hypothetical protein